jgi:hypothetical protein
MKYEDGIGFYGTSQTSFPAIYDHFTITRPGKKLLKEKLFPNPSVELGEALTGDQILFSGENVIKATKGERALLFTYPIWFQGSSYVHLDEWEYPPGNENSLMTPALTPGESILHPGPITLAIFDDIGWNGKVKKPFNTNAPENATAGGNTKDDIKVYPNPFNNQFTVEFNKTSNVTVDVNLFDNYANVYFLGHWSLKKKSHNVDITGFDLEMGIYHLSLEPINSTPIVIQLFKE